MTIVMPPFTVLVALKLHLYLNKGMLSVLSAATILKPVFGPGSAGIEYPVFHDWIKINNMWRDLAF